MFLEYFCLSLSIIDCILQYIEDHPVLVGVGTSVIIGSLWMRKFLRQRRAEAFLSFYSKLSLYIYELQTKLNEKGLLNISDPKSGNIYSLIYVEDYINVACPDFHIPTEEELKPFQPIAADIRELLINTDNNVYPRGTKRDQWYKSQQIIFSFCEFINGEHQHLTNISDDNPHIAKCKSLLDAMNYIQESIYNAKY
ncbi:MAG: hypothetical protein J1F31_06860 [Erysipelotrichales bacterium]|nr:hypothetical protein [Erysipelotrichales bacterium]